MSLARSRSRYRPPARRPGRGLLAVPYPFTEPESAALDALAEGGVTITPGVIHQLEATISPSSFFPANG